ncbi:MAG: hypothetical protein ACC707_00260 [Thiohalomonadales bacterium]
MSSPIRKYKIVCGVSLILLSQGALAIGTLPGINFTERKTEQVSRNILEKCVFGPVCDLPSRNIIDTESFTGVPGTGDIAPYYSTAYFSRAIDSKKLALADELEIQVNVQSHSGILPDCGILVREFFFLYPDTSTSNNIVYCQGRSGDLGSPGFSFEWGQNDTSPKPGSDLSYPIINGVKMERWTTRRNISFKNPRLLYESEPEKMYQSAKRIVPYTMIEYDLSMTEDFRERPANSYGATKTTTGLVTNLPPIRAILLNKDTIRLGCKLGRDVQRTILNQSIEPVSLLQYPEMSTFVAGFNLSKQYDGTTYKPNVQLEKLKSACAGVGDGLEVFGLGAAENRKVNLYIRYGTLVDETNLWDDYATSIRDDLNYRFDIWNSLNNVNNTFASSNTELLAYLQRAANDMRLVLTAYALDPVNLPAFTLAEVDQFFYGPSMGDLAGLYIPTIDVSAAPVSWATFDRFAKDEALKGDPLSPYINYSSEVKLLTALNDVRISGSAAVLVNIVNDALADLENEMSRANYFLLLVAAANTKVQTALSIVQSEITLALGQASAQPLTPLTIITAATAPTNPAPGTTTSSNSFLPITSSNGPNAPITAASYIDVYWTGAAPPAGYNIAIFEEASGLLRIQKSVSAMTFDATTQEWYIALSVTNTTRVGNYIVGFTSANIDTLFGAPRSDVFSVVRP